ncbi:hypothetical protein DL1_09120 [Thioclava dalianensis]|uniref:Uncharacterized protein n=1 Tax=Thioclava dalianensis TaxID=1185766 RepID=A0A074TAF3_9RHOB|nr:hypothetical protein [Thioclava dalianensis]KEP68736.1 hypothetical protein DL1_09120 [Thioclava dalianensis]SFN59318.1 hypothetical protein SAMN05216224_107155 [Thioclava dalianensis]
MQAAARYLMMIGARSAGSPYEIGGIEPVAVWDFDAGVFSAAPSVSRAAPTYGFDAAGRFVLSPADSLRLDARGALSCAVIEDAATNLLRYAVADLGAGWSANGASTSPRVLGALGLFPGVGVRSNGAIWHRLIHSDEPAVQVGATYHLSAFVCLDAVGKVLVTLRNMAAGVESRVELVPGSTQMLGTGAGSLSGAGLRDLEVDGVHRVDLDFTANFNGTLSVGFGPGSAVSGDEITMLGAQIEVGPARSSFIASAGAAMYRPPDLMDWKAPAGIWDMRVVGADGAVSDTPAISVTDGQIPHGLPFAPARVLLYPAGTL